MSNVTPIPERDETVDTIAANIRAEIARAGMTDNQFAHAFGITPMSASRRLSGRTPFTTSEVQRAARMFGVTVESLFAEHRTTPPAGGTNGAAGIRTLYMTEGRTAGNHGEITAVDAALAPVISIFAHQAVNS